MIALFRLLCLELALLPPAVEIVIAFPTYFALVEATPDAELGVCQRAAIALLATLPSMQQDATRLLSKLKRRRFAQLCQHFDWMDGDGVHVGTIQAALALKAVVISLLAVCLRMHAAATVAAAACAVLAVTAGGALLPPVGRLRLAETPAHVLEGLDMDEPLRAMPFVVLACQRTGSNALLGYLQRHPQIQMHNELFNEHYVFTGGASLDWSPAARDSNPGESLTAALCTHADAHRAVGFKLFPEHIRRSEAHHALFERMLADRRVRKIVLKRNNRLAVCTSMLRASTTGTYTHRNYDDVRVAIRPEGLQRFNDTYDGYYTWLDERLRTQPVCRLTYEALCESPADTLAEACAFLGVDAPRAAAISTCFTRQSTTPLRDAVVNFEELRAAFAGTERASDFEIE